MTEPLLLCIDASSSCACVGVSCGVEVLAEEQLTHKQEHAERMYATIQRVLAAARADVQQLQALVVGLGPGSFIGVRIAVATAKGLALGARRPVLGVSTAMSLAAHPSLSGRIGVVIDAKKGQVYAAIYAREGSHFVEHMAPTALSPVQCAQIFGEQQHALTCLVGDGAERFRENFSNFAPNYGAEIVVTTQSMASLAMERIRRDDFDDIATLAPQYVRRAEAEEKRIAAQMAQ